MSLLAKVVKKRYWAFCAYPESLPPDWKDQLVQTGLPCAISPLHDRDVNPTGEVKKAHYHVILCYNGPTALSVVEKLTQQLGQPNPQAIENVKGYYRYLTHKDNPEKAQYEDKDIETLNGFNVADYSELTRSEVLEVKLKIVEIIRTGRITEYCDLMDLLFDSGMMLEWEVASSHTFFFEKYIASLRNKLYLERMKKDERVQTPERGEDAVKDHG